MTYKAMQCQQSSDIAEVRTMSGIGGLRPWRAGAAEGRARFLRA